MARNDTFRVYRDEETMLKVYARRLAMADKKFDRRKPDLERMLAEYEGVVTDRELTSQGQVTKVAKGIGLIDTMFSSMTAIDIEFICRLKGDASQLQSLAAERGLNQAWEDTKGQRHAKDAIKDSLIVDQGWVKVYYDYVEDVEVVDRPEAAVRAELWELRNENPEAGDEELARMVKAVETAPVVLRDRVCVDYVPYDTVRYDPSAKRPEDVRWVAQYTKLPVPEVALNPQFRAFVLDRYGDDDGTRLLDDLDGDSVVKTGLEDDKTFYTMLGSDGESDDRRLTVVEMWDFETGLVTTFPRSRTDLVLYQRQNPLMLNLDLEDRSPFKVLQVRKDPKEFEGLGDMRVIMHGLDELKDYRRSFGQYVQRTVPKLVGPAKALTDAGKVALESTEWGAYIGLSEQMAASDIRPLEVPPLPQELFDATRKIEAELEEATGANQPLRGIFPERRTTATETNIVTTAGERRQAERRSALEDWYLDVARTMLQLMQLYYDRKRMLRYTDDLGDAFVWDWTKEDIAAEADISVALTPKENLTRDERFRRALQVMNLVLPLPEADRASVMQWVLREAGLRDEEIRAMVKQPEEVAADQKAQQLQQALLGVQPQRFAGAPPGLSIFPQAVR